MATAFILVLLFGGREVKRRSSGTVDVVESEFAASSRNDTDTQVSPPRVSGNHELLCSVQTTEGRPLIGAEVSLVTATGLPVAVAMAGEDGRASVSEWAGPTAFVWARHPEFAPTRAVDPRSSPGEPGTVELVLSVGTSLTGFVRAVDDSPIEGVSVYAIERGFFNAPISELARHPGCYRTVSDDGGHFALDGLRGGQEYEVLAVGDGLVPPGPKARSIARGGQRDPVLLRVAPLYAVAVRILDSDGEDLPALESDNFSVLSGIDGLEPFGDERVMSAAGAVLPEDFQRPRKPHRFLFMFTAVRVAERVGPLHLHAAAPGYRSAEATVWGTRASGHKLVVQEVRLNRLAGMAFGSVRFALPDPLQARTDVPPQSLGILRLFPEGWQIEGTGYLETWLRLPMLEPALVVGVPSGRYAVRLVNSLLAPGTSPLVARVDVRPDETVLVNLAFPACGSLTILSTVESVGPDGRQEVLPFSGTLQINVHYGDQFRYSLPAALAQRPYELLGIAPGQYQIRCNAHGYSEVVEDIVIEAGSCTRVRAHFVPEQGQDGR